MNFTIRHIFISVLLFAISSVANAYEKVTYHHWDALGSPVASSDATGRVIWKETYQPYGETIQNPPEAAANTRGYTGHVKDKETGLTYAGARYYDPVVGRFYGVDPKTFTPDDLQSFNRYAYGNNNPYKYVDPDGRKVVLSGHVAATPFGYATTPTSYHMSIVMMPDHPQDFKNRAGWSEGANGKISATLGGQPSNGKLVSSPNNSGDRLEKGAFQQEVPTPSGMSDTDFVNRLLKAAGSYGNNLRYQKLPDQNGDGYNSNSYASGILKAAGANPPGLDIPVSGRGLPTFKAPGYEKPIPLAH